MAQRPYNRMPYWLTARYYHEAGWSPIPLPFAEKHPTPDDVQGGSAPYVSEAQIARWLGYKEIPGKGFRGRPEKARAGKMEFIPGNIALRLPPNVIGIDVDLYGGKTGAQTLAEAEAKWGELEPTWVSTSRTDGSGIRYYRLPDSALGLKWRDVGPGVETIKWYHRYAIVFPSIHDKTGSQYYWIRPDGISTGAGGAEEVEFPSVDELVLMSQAWIEGLTGGERYTGGGDAGDIDYKSALDWVNDYGDGDPCSTMLDTLNTYTRKVREAGEDGGAHDAARDGAWALVGDAGLGHTGLSKAIAKLGIVFLNAISNRRDPSQAQGEWRRIVVKGVGKVREELRQAGGDGSVTDPDPCDMFSAESRPARRAGTGSSGFDWERDDIGNAQRLRTQVAGEARWVEAWNSWVVYDPETRLWDRKRGNDRMREAVMKTVRKMGEEAEFIEDAESLKAFKSWVKTSGTATRMEAMMKWARPMGGMWAHAEEYDAQWSDLHVANGVVVLGDEVTFRPRVLEDMATLCAPVEYHEGARSKLWERFLNDVLPDDETRHWVQKLVGMSLIGGNPERAMIFGIGRTTSGKSTFVEVLAACLGGYAAPYNLQMFREKRDEGPRVDLLGAMPRRFLYCTEASADVQLHVDAIKRMTGGDMLTARGMASNTYVNAVPAFTPWLVTNETPSIPGADEALKRRIKVAPFNVSLRPDQVDTTLRPRLLAATELPGVLAWAVEGWNLYRVEGLEDGGSLEVSEATFEVRESINLLESWLREACEFGPDCAERTEDLREAYRTWLEMKGEEDKRHSSTSGLGRALSANGYPKQRMSVDGVQSIYRVGLRLKRVSARG